MKSDKFKFIKYIAGSIMVVAFGSALYYLSLLKKYDFSSMDQEDDSCVTINGRKYVALQDRRTE